MSTDKDVRRLNLWIKSLSTQDLLEYTSDELAEVFMRIPNKHIEKIDKKISEKPKIVVPRTYRNEHRMPSDEGFWTPPRSNKSSGAESTDYRSTP
jgi:hypothetical protein